MSTRAWFAPSRPPRARRNARARARTRPIDDVDVARALAAARAGADAAKKLRQRTMHRMKRDGTPVTAADVAAQRACAVTLARCGSAHAFVGEERAVDVDADAAWTRATAAAFKRANANANARGDDESGPWWVCDPVDGTKAFVARDGSGQFVTGLALVDADGVRVAAMVAPMWAGGGAEIVAARGAGCFARRGGEKEFYRAVCARAETLGDVRAVISAHETFTKLPLGVAIGEPKSVIKLCCGSLCKYVSVALGESNVFIQHPSARGDGFVNTWDHAAGVLCCAEAGAVVSDLHGDPLNFASDRRRLAPGGGGIICAAKEIHTDVVRAFRVGSSNM